MEEGSDRASEGALTPERWQDLLSLELSTRVRVVYTRARRTPIQVKRVGSSRRGATSGLEVRLHSMFAAAPPPVHKAVASWIRSGNRAPRACAELDDWIAAALDALPRATRVTEEDALGEVHDLVRLARELLENEFAGDFGTDSPVPAITWGRRGPSRTRNSLRLGSFDPDPRLVRIHPVLDQASVPEWFVRFVLFHELLHAVHPPERNAKNRWVHHGRVFQKRERTYVDYSRAISWERRNLRALILSARRGTAFTPVAEKQPNTPPAPVPARAEKRSLLQRLLFPF